MNREQFLNYINTTEPLSEETLSQVKKITEDFPWFSAGWLLYLKNLKAINHPDYDLVLKKVAVMVPDRKVLYQFLHNKLPKAELEYSANSASSAYRLEGDIELKSETSLIDKFLSNESARLKMEQINSENNKEGSRKVLVDQSVAEDQELVTETLASIYMQQKNFVKALEAYKKLSLKYPEKSIYFAGRIEEIESLKNNN